MYLAFVEDFLCIEIQVVLVDDVTIGEQPDWTDDKELNLSDGRDIVKEVSQHA